MDIIMQNPGPKYSEAFITLVKPYIESLPDTIDIETICELGQFAWNTSIMMKKDPVIIPSFKSLFSSMAINKDEKEMNEVFQKMINDKNTIFPEYDYCIAEFELREDAAGELIIKILSQSYEDYVANMANPANLLPDSDLLSDIINPPRKGFIDRQALIIKIKQPFIDWVKSLQNEGAENNFAPLIYLLNEERSPDKWISRNFKKIFKHILKIYCKKTKQYPNELTKQLFDEWFDIEISDYVLDLENAPVVKIGI